MKYLEDNKLEVTKKLDNIIDGNSNIDQEKLQQREESYKEISEEPKQNWGSFITSRLAATVAILTLYFSLGRRTNIISFFKKDGFKGTDELSDSLGKKSYDFLNESKVVAKENPNWLDKTVKWFDDTKVSLNNSFSKKLGDGPVKLEEKYRTKSIEKADDFNVIDGETRNIKIHALAINETSYALIMASIVFGFTRVFGNLFHKNDDKNIAENAADNSKTINVDNPISDITNDNIDKLPKPKTPVVDDEKTIVKHIDNTGGTMQYSEDEIAHHAHNTFSLNGHTVLAPPQQNSLTSTAHNGRLANAPELGLGGNANNSSSA